MMSTQEGKSGISMAGRGPWADALGAVEFQDYFVILPSIPLWDLEEFMQKSSEAPGRLCRSDFSYNSGTNDHFLSVEELRDLISRNIDA